MTLFRSVFLTLTGSLCFTIRLFLNDLDIDVALRTCLYIIIPRLLPRNQKDEADLQAGADAVVVDPVGEHREEAPRWARRASVVAAAPSSSSTRPYRARIRARAGPL